MQPFPSAGQESCSTSNEGSPQLPVTGGATALARGPSEPWALKGVAPSRPGDGLWPGLESRGGRAPGLAAADPVAACFVKLL